MGTTDRSRTGAWPDTSGTVTYGGPSDLWGTTLTPSDVNDPTFGAALSTKYAAQAGNAWCYVDQMTIKVYFSVTCN